MSLNIKGICLLEKIVFKDYNELSKQTAKFIAERIIEKPNSLLCFPAGETSIGTFDELIKLRDKGLFDFSKCKFVGLDEWVNLGNMENENCYNFLRMRFYDKAGIHKNNLCFFNGEANNLNYECEKTETFIKENNGIDLMLLGVGMNGHVGLNEPGTSLDNYSHVVDLDEVTKKVGQKYFTQHVELSLGITLGIKNIMDSSIVILQLSGKQKSKIVKIILESKITNNFPASIIKLHKNSYLFIDEEAQNYD